MRIAKAIAITIGGTILGFLVVYSIVPEWFLMTLRRNFWLIAGGFVVSAALSGVVYGGDIVESVSELSAKNAEYEELGA